MSLSRMFKVLSDFSVVCGFLTVYTVFARFVARAHIQLNSLPGPYSSTGACYFQSKITGIHKNYGIFEDKHFTTLILFPCQLIHVKHKLFIHVLRVIPSCYP